VLTIQQDKFKNHIVGTDFTYMTEVKKE